MSWLTNILGSLAPVAPPANRFTTTRSCVACGGLYSLASRGPGDPATPSLCDQCLKSRLGHRLVPWQDS